MSALGEQDPYRQNEEVGQGSQSQCLQCPGRNVSEGESWGGVGGRRADLPLPRGALASPLTSVTALVTVAPVWTDLPIS